jgi:hypothetical protein
MAERFELRRPFDSRIPIYDLQDLLCRATKRVLPTTRKGNRNKGTECMRSAPTVCCNPFPGHGVKVAPMLRRDGPRLGGLLGVYDARTEKWL